MYTKGTNDLNLLGNPVGPKKWTRRSSFMSFFSSGISTDFDEKNEESDDEELMESEVLGAFEVKELKAAFAVVSQGESTIDMTSVEDVFLSLGFTLEQTELAHILRSVHTDKHGNVPLDSLEHTYMQWRKCCSERGKGFLLDYRKNLDVLYKLLLKVILLNYDIPNLFLLIDLQLVIFCYCSINVCLRCINYEIVRR